MLMGIDIYFVVALIYQSTENDISVSIEPRKIIASANLLV